MENSLGTEKHSPPRSNKSKATPPRVVFFLHPPPFLYIIPRKIARSKNRLKPCRSFCKTDVQLKGAWHPKAISMVMAPGSCLLQLKAHPGTVLCAPPGTHLTSPMLEHWGCLSPSWLPLHPLTAARVETEGCAFREARSWALVSQAAQLSLCSDANMCTTARAGRALDTPSGYPTPHKG